ncbi:MAG: hypothetical protein E7665_02525 [Ruminococcaceae bacterium]|nr:hypothetical protein [Oscillospiraceae bacterium]
MNATKVSIIEKQYKAELNKYLHCDEDAIFFYWKGRVALYEILRAMGVGEGDEVLVQGYTCVVVANAIMYLKATPIYADIDKKTFNMNLDSLKSRITEKTKVIICQNTYGLSSNLEELEQIAREYGQKYGHAIYTIEDCTHGFGGKYHGKSNGVSCDASFFSTQWSKPFTTGVGGFSVIHNSDIRAKVKKNQADLVQPGLKEVVELKLMYFVRQYVINDFTYWPMIRLYRWMSRHNLVVGSSSGEEIVGVEMPEGYLKAQSAVQMKKGIKSVKRLDAVNELRRKNAQVYTEFLNKHGKYYVDESLHADHIFIRYPLLVNDREEFRKRAEDAKVILGEWFEAPVYPADASLATWKVDTSVLPVAMDVCEHMVNLPTDEKNVAKVIAFLEKQIDLVQ